MQKHVHARQCPSATVDLLSEHRKVTTAGPFNQTGSLYQQASSSAGRITNTITGFGFGQPGQQAIGQTRNTVLLMHQQRHAAQPGGHTAGTGSEATKADGGAWPMAPDHAPGLPDGA